MSKLMRWPEAMAGRDTFGFFEDWVDNFVTGDRWTPLTTDSSSASTLVIVDLATAGGVLEITQDATDNDEIYFVPTIKSFLIAADKQLYFEARIQYTEGATDDNNVMVGWLSTGAANTLIDDGGGPVASATMAVIYKIDGGTVWRCRSQIGAAVGKTDTISDSTAGGSAYQVLGVEVNPYSSTKAKVIYTIDGNPLRETNGDAITHDLTYTNAVAMGPFFGVKNGSATAEVTLCDYIAAFQDR
mgnify:FL=1